MKVSELLNELKQSEVYKNFKEENPEAFFCSAMFVLGDADKIDINFFIPSQNRISSFSMPFASITNHQEEIKDQTEIKDLNFKVDIYDLKKSIEEKTGKKFSQIIAVLQKGNWNLTCLNGLDMSRMNLNAYTGEIQKKDEGSLMDMVRFKKEN
ncbi:MAG: hypothetical protein KKF50_01020 [Nanoarchaeota archaeon]|nr:hypothetical protein [Nanoarchaeota archaeon]